MIHVIPPLFSIFPYISGNKMGKNSSCFQFKQRSLPMKGNVVFVLSLLMLYTLQDYEGI